jgi:hypothetical protein
MEFLLHPKTSPESHSTLRTGKTMTDSTLALVQSKHRYARLKRRQSLAVYGEPPADLALTVEVEIADQDLLDTLFPASLRDVLHWLREDMSERDYVEHLIGQEVELATFACWLNGLMPAVGSEREIAGAIFGIRETDLVPHITGTELCCVGYTLGGLWYTGVEVAARKICVDMVNGTISVVATWFPK